MNLLFICFDYSLCLLVVFVVFVFIGSLYCFVLSVCLIVLLVCLVWLVDLVVLSSFGCCLFVSVVILVLCACYFGL